MTDLHDRILNAALALYSRAGFRGTTTRLIAREAEVNEVTLFRHFKNKALLLKEALQQFSHLPCRRLGTAEGSDPAPRHPRAELKAWALETYHHWYGGRHLISRVMGDLPEHPELAPDICQEPASEHATLARYLERMRDAGVAGRDFDPDITAGLLLGAIFSHAIWRDFLNRPDLPPAETVIAEFVDLVLTSIGTPPGPEAP